LNLVKEMAAVLLDKNQRRENKRYPLTVSCNQALAPYRKNLSLKKRGITNVESNFCKTGSSKDLWPVELG